MTKNFNELKVKLSPKAQERVATKTKQMLAEMPLNELRKKRALSKK
jgi:hypothetical protein